MRNRHDNLLGANDPHRLLTEFKISVGSYERYVGGITPNSDPYHVFGFCHSSCIYQVPRTAKINFGDRVKILRRQIRRVNADNPRRNSGCTGDGYQDMGIVSANAPAIPKCVVRCCTGIARSRHIIEGPINPIARCSNQDPARETLKILNDKIVKFLRMAVTRGHQVTDHVTWQRRQHFLMQVLQLYC